MKAFLISVLLAVIVFFLIMNNDEKRAVLIMIFTLPFFYYPLDNTKIHFGIKIGMCGLIVFSVWLAMKLPTKTSKKYIMNWKELSPKVISLYYFLIMGIVLGYIYYGDGLKYMGGSKYYRLTPSEQILNNSIFIILVILLLKILVNFQYDDLFRARIAKVFIFTIFVQVFSQMLKVLGMENILWSLFSAGGLFEREDVRNLGLWGGFGLGVYIVLIVSLSLLYYNKHKFLSKAAIMAAIAFSLLSGQRQTIAFIILFFIMITYIYTLKSKISITYMLSILFISIASIIIWDTYLSKTVVFRRFSPAMSLIEQGEILKASGRNVEGIPFVLADLKTYPISGKGSLNLGITKYSYSNIAGHVVWFNIFQKFGIVGVIYLITILIYPLVKIFKIIKITKDQHVLQEGAILFSLMVTLFAQQFWDNFFWFSNTMLLYAFIFFWIFSFINRQKLLNEKLKIT